MYIHSIYIYIYVSRVPPPQKKPWFGGLELHLYVHARPVAPNFSLTERSGALVASYEDAGAVGTAPRPSRWSVAALSPSQEHGQGI